MGFVFQKYGAMDRSFWMWWNSVREDWPTINLAVGDNPISSKPAPSRQKAGCPPCPQYAVPSSSASGPSYRGLHQWVPGVLKGSCYSVGIQENGCDLCSGLPAFTGPGNLWQIRLPGPGFPPRKDFAGWPMPSIHGRGACHPCGKAGGMTPTSFQTPRNFFARVAGRS